MTGVGFCCRECQGKRWKLVGEGDHYLG